MRPQTVCVIGAGAAGLASIKVCIDAGLDVTAFEQMDRIGGLWNKNSSSSSQTVTNSSSRMSSFSDFPIPNDWPKFLPRHQVIQYLNDYADHFHLKQYIHFCCMILKVERRKRDFCVTVSNSRTGETFTSLFDCLMVCTGHHTDPVIPIVPGSQTFTGKIVHSKFFDPQDFDLTNKTVVVIGSGNSAGDVAVEAGNNVVWAMRSGNHIIRRTTVNGDPVDEVFFTRLTRFGLQLVAPFRSMRNALVKKINHYLHFDPDEYNLPAVRHGMLDRQSIINDLILPKLMTGKMHILPIQKIDHFTPDSIVFLQPDDSKISIRCDMVIYGTGYKQRSQFVESITGKNSSYLFRKICPPEDLRIGLIGHVQPLGPQFPLMEMQARYFIWLQGRPAVSMDTISRCIRRDQQESRRKNRDCLTISWSHYMTLLASEMGIEPPLCTLFFTNHKLWRKMFFSPMTADRYRMFGSMNRPGKQRTWAE